MQKMSVTEFNRYLSWHPERKLVFHSDDQEGISKFNNDPSIDIVGNNIICCTNPNILILQDENSKLMFSGIKYISVENNKDESDVSICCRYGVDGDTKNYYLILL